MSEPSDLSELRERAQAYVEAFDLSNAPLPDEFPTSQMREIGRVLAELDGSGGEDEQRALVRAHAKLRESREALRLHVNKPDAPSYFEVERAHNALFVELDGLIAVVPQQTLIALQPPRDGQTMVVRRVEAEDKIRSLEKRVEATEAQARRTLEQIAERRTVLAIVYIESLELHLGNMVKVVMSFSAELKASLIDLPWIAELSRRLGQLASRLGEAIDATRRAAGQLVDILTNAEEARRLADRVVAGGKTVLKWIRRALGRRPAANRGRAIFRDIDAAWCPEMVEIPRGRFLMGPAPGEAGSDDRERPRHEVEIAYRFALGRYPVTFDEYDHFCRETLREEPSDSGWGRGRRPVINVSWDDAMAYCEWLSRETRASYRLPSEAKWEYACRAGTTTAYSWGDDFDRKRANAGDKQGRTSDVGCFPANGWGLHDMHGNVWEWCADLWHGSYQGAPTDGSVWETGGDPDGCVVRGGAWLDSPQYARAAFRGWNGREYRGSNLGFRVASMLTS